MEIVKYSNEYKLDFIKLFLLFGETVGHNVKGKKLIIKKLESRLKKDAKNLYLGIVGNEIIGFLWGNIIIKENIFSSNKKIGNISYFFIRKDMQHKGYATKLKNYFFNDLESLGISKVKLKVNKKNTGAMNIYKKWLFKESNKLELILNK